MERGNVERRRGRRANLEAPLLIRRAGTAKPEPFKEEVAKNVSLAGVYFETDSGDHYTVNDVLITSVSVPESQTRNFPFSRIAGRGRVVRVKELPQDDPSGRKRFGIAVEFGEDITALTAIPVRS